MNLNEIQDLIKFVAKSGVSEVEIEQKDFKIVIKAEQKKVEELERKVKNADDPYEKECLTWTPTPCSVPSPSTTACFSSARLSASRDSPAPPRWAGQPGWWYTPSRINAQVYTV